MFVPQERSRALWAIPEKEKFKVDGKQKHHSPLAVEERRKSSEEGFPKSMKDFRKQVVPC